MYGSGENWYNYDANSGLGFLVSQYQTAGPKSRRFLAVRMLRMVNQYFRMATEAKFELPIVSVAIVLDSFSKREINLPRGIIARIIQKGRSISDLPYLESAIYSLESAVSRLEMQNERFRPGSRVRRALDSSKNRWRPGFANLSGLPPALAPKRKLAYLR